MSMLLYLLTNLLNGLMGMGLLLLGYKVFDWITGNEWDFTKVFREKGVSGGSIIVAAFIIGLSWIIGNATF